DGSSSAYLVLLRDKKQQPWSIEVTEWADDYLETRDAVRLHFIMGKALNQMGQASNMLQENVVVEQISRITRTGSWRWMVESNAVFWSPQLYEIFERDSALGAPSLEEVYTYFGPEQLRLRESVELALTKGREYDLELAVLTEEGNERIVRAIGVPVGVGSGSAAELRGIVADITSQKRILQELQESEMRLDLAVNGAELGIWDIDLSTGAHFTNRRWWEMLGYAHEEVTYTVEFLESLLHPEDQHLPAKEIGRIESGGINEINLTLRLRARDGEYRTILHRGRVAEFNERGKAKRVVGTHMNLTRQYQVQRELEKTKQFMDLAVVGGEIGLWELDLVTDQTYFNVMWHEMLGYDREEVEFSLAYFQSLLHPEDAAIPGVHMQKMLDGIDDVYEAVFRMRAKNGTYRYILAHGQFVSWDAKGAPTKLAGSHLDITAQVKAEHSYEQANRKLRALIDAAPIGVYLLDREGVVIDLWNPAAEKIFGYSKEEALGAILPLITTDVPEAKGFFDFLKDGGAFVQQRLKTTNRQGKEVDLEITTGTQFDERGAFESVLVVASDVTDLVRKKQHLEEALNDKHILIQETHHRIKNNLAMVSSIIDMQRLQSGNSRYLDSATSRIQSIAMVHELLYKTGDFKHVSIRNYYEKLVESILDALTDAAEKPRYALSVDIPNIGTQQAIPLGLLLNELITNSIKYAMRSDGPLFEVAMTMADGVLIEFSYRDYGPGFDTEGQEESEGFGFQLIKSLLSQLRADYRFNGHSGFQLDFHFPMEEGQLVRAPR
ncbi:MAG: PAS domain-containing protein, partial [Bacteroidota bacterium]